MVPLKGAKQSKNVKDKRASSLDSREELGGAEVRRGPCTWAPQLELESAPIPWDAIIWES